MIYSVSYDLSKRPRTVTKRPQPLNAFYDELQASRNWWHYLDRTWLLSTTESANELNERLRRHLVDDDMLLIMKVEADYAGWLPQDAWDWLEERRLAGEFVH